MLLTNNVGATLMTCVVVDWRHLQHYQWWCVWLPHLHPHPITATVSNIGHARNLQETNCCQWPNWGLELCCVHYKPSVWCRCDPWCTLHWHMITVSLMVVKQSPSSKVSRRVWKTPSGSFSMFSFPIASTSSLCTLPYTVIISLFCFDTIIVIAHLYNYKPNYLGMRTNVDLVLPKDLPRIYLGRSSIVKHVISYGEHSKPS